VTVSVRVDVRGAKATLWREALARALPEARFDHTATDVDYLVAWRPPLEIFERVRVRKAVFNLGAGVDALLDVPSLPPGLAVYRLSDAGMAEQMAEYAVMTVLRAYREMDVYARAQSDARWAPRERLDKSHFGIAVLGLGVLGRAVIDALRPFRFPLYGHARRPCALDGVEVFAGAAALQPCLARARVCICLLPSTPDTRDLFDRTRLAWLPSGAHLVNLSRGDLVVERDLIDALDRGHLASATLDVFRDEPLPPTHPFWHHPKVTLTPHVSALTLMGPSVAQVAAGIRAIESGREPPGRVDRSHGY
jgi:glyoxylate/hydroxypyruvate reductase A